MVPRSRPDGWQADARARANLDWLWAQMGAVQDLCMPAWMAGNLTLPAGLTPAMDVSWPAAMAEGVARLVSPYA